MTNFGDGKEHFSTFQQTKGNFNFENILLINIVILKSFNFDANICKNRQKLCCYALSATSSFNLKLCLIQVKLELMSFCFYVYYINRSCIQPHFASSTINRFMTTKFHMKQKVYWFWSRHLRKVKVTVKENVSYFIFSLRSLSCLWKVES